jgi:hypothetical protein
MLRARIRAGTPEDSAAVARMANALNRELGIDGDPFTPAGVLADGFGEHPCFALLVAEVDGALGASGGSVRTMEIKGQELQALASEAGSDSVEHGSKTAP